MPKSNPNDALHAAIWAEARAAAQAAAEAHQQTLPPEARRGFDCGFAWVTLPGTLPFTKWAKKQGIATKSYPSGYQIWYSKLHNLPTQSVSVHEAATHAARDHLASALGSSQIEAASRLD